MAIYSYSQLTMFEACPLRYKLAYVDRIKRKTETIEAFLGSRVHETLKKMYDDAHYTRTDTLEDVLGYFERFWEQNRHDEIVIANKDLTESHYRGLGRKMIETYYRRYAPFDNETTVSTERMLSFKLDTEGKYRMRGILDRLSLSGGMHCIHDYKTSALLPGQEEADADRQLALYEIAVRQTWPDVKDVKLVWHYLAFDRELVSSRSSGALSALKSEMTGTIDRIESAAEFPPGESRLCDWCEYPDLCPNRKHLFAVEKLPENEYIKEPGVVLANRFAELKEKQLQIETELEKVRDAVIKYARDQNMFSIRGSGALVRIKFDKKLKFPGKNDAERESLENLIIGAGRWSDCSSLDTSALSHIIDRKGWEPGLIQQVMKFGRQEESSTVTVAKVEKTKEVNNK